MDYPASLHIETPERIARWRPLVHWLLAIPQIIVTALFGYVRNNLTIISWLIIVFRGRLPEGLATIQAMLLRYGLRVSTYTGFLHDTYPPCDFDLSNADPGGSPVVANYSPETENRKRLTTFFRPILAIPALIFSLLVWIVAVICHVLGGLAVLVMGRWPAFLRNWVVKSLVVSNRLSAYTLLMTDKYPPFSTR